MYVYIMIVSAITRDDLCYVCMSLEWRSHCDVGLEEGEYEQNDLYAAVLCTSIMVHSGTSSSYKSVDSTRL